VHPDDFRNYQTDKIRDRFLINGLVKAGEINCAYTHYDRMIVGAANPVNKGIMLPNYPNLRSDFFLQRREIGIINVAGDGEIIVDEKTYLLKKMDCLYIGKGAKTVAFLSKDPQKPAVFYWLSAPAHAQQPTALMTQADAV